MMNNYSDVTPVVLLVEDELLVRMAAAEDLQDAGFHVMEAANADVASPVTGSTAYTVFVARIAWVTVVPSGDQALIVSGFVVSVIRSPMSRAGADPSAGATAIHPAPSETSAAVGKMNRWMRIREPSGE